MQPVGRFTVSVDHPALPGHFPGRPVIPGVVLLDYAAACLGLTPIDFRRVKFLSPVKPGQVVEVSCEPAAGGQTAFDCACEGRSVITGHISVGSAGGESPPPRPPALIKATGGSPAGSGAEPQRFP